MENNWKYEFGGTNVLTYKIQATITDEEGNEALFLFDSGYLTKEFVAFTKEYISSLDEEISLREYYKDMNGEHFFWAPRPTYEPIYKNAGPTYRNIGGGVWSRY